MMKTVYIRNEAETIMNYLMHVKSRVDIIAR